MITYILARLAERSTWSGLVALVGGLLVKEYPSLAQEIATYGAMLIGALHVATPDTKA